MNPKNFSKIVVLGVGAVIGTAFFSIFVYPKMHSEEYRAIQATAVDETLKKKMNLNPEKLPAWRDPFKRDKTG